MFCCRNWCSTSKIYTIQKQQQDRAERKHEKATPSIGHVDGATNDEVEKVGDNVAASGFDGTERRTSDSSSSISSAAATPRDSTNQRKKRVGFISKAVTDVDKEIVKYPKNENEVNLIKNAIASSDFFANVVNETCIDDIVDSMYLKEIHVTTDKDDDDLAIIKQGDDGDFLCVSAGGRYDVYVDDVVVYSFDNYRVFGEYAILYNTKRNATVKCHRNDQLCRLWILDRDVYQRINIRNAIEERDERLRFLKQVPVINAADDVDLMHVVALFKREFFKMKTTIVREGDVGDKFYIVRAGSVTISKRDEGVVGTLTKGQFFGERALFNESDTRAATVVADAPGCECLTLDRHDFLRHFGNIDEFSKNRATIESGRTGKDESHAPNKAQQPQYADIDIGDLKIVATLGVGGFGRVELVRHRRDASLTFALKYLRKSDMVREQQQEHVFNEKMIQMDCYASPFIVKLYRTYRDTKYLYFLMESCLGGDLFALIQRQKLRRFDERHARFYAACVVEALAFLHTRSYVYRDLKPENLMLDARGYLKLTDFGFAKKLYTPHERSYTFAGTPEYVAPEIIAQRGHDKAVDYWALGILIYELLTGGTPFKQQQQQQQQQSDNGHIAIYNRILSGIENVRFPVALVPKSAQNLIKKLCRSNPTERLGCQKDGADAVRNHRWFDDFKWAQLQQCTMKAPHVPKLKNNVDLRYVERFTKDTDIPDDDLTGWDEDF